MTGTSVCWESSSAQLTPARKWTPLTTMTSSNTGIHTCTDMHAGSIIHFNVCIVPHVIHISIRTLYVTIGI